MNNFKDRTDFPYIEKLLQAIYDLKDIDDFEFAYSLAEHAVSKVMEAAKWNDETITITLIDVPGLDKPEVVTTRGELENCLIVCAELVFYSNISQKDEPGFVGESVVELVLSSYEDRLNFFFPNESVRFERAKRDPRRRNKYG